MSDPVEAWIEALTARHTRGFTSGEFLKAVRALSVRYVERRSALPSRSPTDSAGKRAAFAAYFAPLHFVATRAVVRALDATPDGVSRIVDLGCGTGAASAAWALASEAPPEIHGVDRERWALDDAVWNWRQLGLRGRAVRGDLVSAAASLLSGRRADLARTALLLAWSVNELESRARERLRPLLLDAAAGGAAVLLIEPIARTAVPWWDEWAGAWRDAGGVADEWKFDITLPAALERVRDNAGFTASPLGARSLWLPARRNGRATIG